MSLELVDHDRLKWMVEAREVQDWLSFPKSQILLINGNGESNDMYAPTTVLSAKLLERLGRIEPIISLSFFCSLHMDSSTFSTDNAAGLLKSFVRQLLQRDIPWDLTFISSRHDLWRIQMDDLSTIRKLLQGLMVQLPNQTFLFLMIDGINYYERSARRRDFLKAMDVLLGIIKDDNRMIIKLLLTCHGTSFFVKNLLDKDRILHVPATIDGDHQGWSEEWYERKIGPQMEKLRAAAVGN